MKNLILASVVALTAFAAPASADTLCAEKGRFGWKITGPSFTANFTDWQANKAIGEAIGDGKCQSGWDMSSSVDPRIQGMPSSFSKLTSSDSVATVRGSSSNTVTNDAGRITTAYNGNAPAILKGTRSGAGDKWKLVQSDGNGGGTYKVIRPGNTSRSRGDTLLFTSQMLQDRDNNGNCTVNSRFCRNLRYAASQDTTTTVTDYDVENTRTYNVTKYRTFCPSVWTYTFVNPTGQAVASAKGYEGQCVTRSYVSQYTVSAPSTVSKTTVTVGSKYVSN